MTLKTIFTACALFAITNTNTYGAWTFSECKSKCNNDTCHNKDLKQECSDNCNKLVIGDCLNTPESNSQPPKPSPKVSGVPTRAEDTASKLGSAVQGAANTGAQSAQVGSQDVPNAQQNINRPPRQLPPRPPKGSANSALPSEPQRTASSDSKMPSQPSTSSLLGSHRKLPSKNLGEQGKVPMPHGASGESAALGAESAASQIQNIKSAMSTSELAVAQIEMLKEIEKQADQCFAMGRKVAREAAENQADYDRQIDITEGAKPIFPSTIKSIFPVNPNFIQETTDFKNMDHQSFLVHLKEQAKTTKNTIADMLSKVLKWSDKSKLKSYQQSISEDLRAMSSFCTGPVKMVEEAIKYKKENPSVPTAEVKEKPGILKKFANKITGK
jgi:hypothetical protein